MLAMALGGLVAYGETGERSDPSRRTLYRLCRQNSGQPAVRRARCRQPLPPKAFRNHQRHSASLSRPMQKDPITPPPNSQKLSSRAQFPFPATPGPETPRQILLPAPLLTASILESHQYPTPRTNSPGTATDRVSHHPYPPNLASRLPLLLSTRHIRLTLVIIVLGILVTRLT